MNLPRHLTHQSVKQGRRIVGWVPEPVVPAAPFRRALTRRINELCGFADTHRPHDSCGAWRTILEIYADRFGCDPKTAERHLGYLMADGRKARSIPAPFADRVAIACDTHPYLVLGNQWLPKDRVAA